MPLPSIGDVPALLVFLCPGVAFIYGRSVFLSGASPHLDKEIRITKAGDGRNPANDVAPDAAQLGIGNISAIDVAVENVLMRGSAEFHDDVANLFGKARIADQSDEEIFLMRHAVHIAQADQGIFFKGGKYAVGGGTDGRRGPIWRLRVCGGRNGEYCREHQDGK